LLRLQFVHFSSVKQTFHFHFFNFSTFICTFAAQMKVAVVKYNAGNIFSVVHALKRMGVEPLLTDSEVELRSADKVIFPGQGEASNAMSYLRERGLDKVIPSLTQPVLGICIGQQLMCRHSEEGDTDCLGIFNAEVKRFVPVKHEDKIPHMGWNSLSLLKGEDKKSPFKGDLEGLFVYFVHSFYVPVCEDTAAITEYIHPFSAAMQKDNFFATQFHPEKSGEVGQQILRNFLEL
jgi:glutamine amidotransferase